MGGGAKVTVMVLKVDLRCKKCYQKIKKVLCSTPQIRDQLFDEKSNTVTITVLCRTPEKVADKICSKAGGTIKGIDIKPSQPPAKPKKAQGQPPPPQQQRQPKQAADNNPKSAPPPAEKPKSTAPPQGDKPKGGGGGGGDSEKQKPQQQMPPKMGSPPQQQQFPMGPPADGELDLICKTLGLSGPEDLAISLADWKARKIISPVVRTERFTDASEVEHTSMIEVQVCDKLESLSKLSSEVDTCADIGRIEIMKEEICVENDLASDTTSEIVAPSMNVEAGGLRGQRPPVLHPLPWTIPNHGVDLASSTWDLCRSFGPQDNMHVDSHMHQENGSLIMIHVGKLSCKQLRSDKSIEKMRKNVFKEPVYGISPNGKLKHTISFWQKGELLGSGSFGTVYEGFTDNGFFFAVKEVSLLDEGSRGKQSIYQLEQEISLLSRFEHENIVQYLGTDKDNAKLFIFLELVTKGSLLSLYQKYHLKDSQVSAYTRQILNGLKYLHERNVIHRDIKCANILVDVSGSVKLTDFGLAKATKFNDVKSCKGTALWMAPEVVNQKGNGYGLAADIWSLGCTVLEMLTREFPYSNLEGFQALFRIGKGELPLVPDTLSKDARDFIFTCLRPDPNQRPSAAQLLEHPFVAKVPQTPTITKRV